MNASNIGKNNACVVYMVSIYISHNYAIRDGFHFVNQHILFLLKFQHVPQTHVINEKLYVHELAL